MIFHPFNPKEENYLVLLPATLAPPDRKFDENFEGARRLDPVRAPSRPAPPELEVLKLILLMLTLLEDTNKSVTKLKWQMS